MKILALDPGGATGWAAYDDEAKLPSNVTPDRSDEFKHSCGQFESEDHHDNLMTFMTIVHPDVLICEQFEYRQRTAGGIRMKIDLVSREYIGVVKLYVQRRYGSCELIMQPPSVCNGTRLVTDGFIKKLGLWRPGLRHAMDAREHLIYYLVTALNRKDLIPRDL